MERVTPEAPHGNFYVWLFDTRKIVLSKDQAGLDFLQFLVDGHVEHVNPHPSRVVDVGFVFDLWVNDEFRSRGEWSVNQMASFLAGQTIIGPAVVCVVDSHGNTRGMTRGQVKELEKFGILVERHGSDAEILSTVKSLMGAKKN